MATNPSGEGARVEQATGIDTSSDPEGGPSGSRAGVSSLFCRCGGLRAPDEEWRCRGCGEAAPDAAVELTVTERQEVREPSVVTDTFFLGPKTPTTCPACGHGKAHYRLQQTRSADESETRFFTCPECEHEWREQD